MVEDSHIRQSLLHILRTATSLKDTCSAYALSSRSLPSPTGSYSPSSIVLPAPPSIHQKLLDIGLDSGVATVLSQGYARRSGELHLKSQDSLARACRDLAGLPQNPGLMHPPELLNRVVDSYTTNYLRALKVLESRAIQLASNIQPPIAHHRKPVDRRDRIRFNHDFIPFLQKYFEYNAFPSVVDREEMAKKSMMEPRQIEVWFQNHRRRAKAEGKPIPKLAASDPAPLELCLRSMEEKMESYLIPDDMRQSIDNEVSEAGSDDEEDDEEFYDKPQDVDLSDVLNPPAPLHAFPMHWSRICKSPTAIRSTSQFSFPAPEWPRKASVAPVKRPAVTMDELEQAFKLFHVYDKTRVLSPPFRIPTTVTPQSAPLPALVRGKFTPSPVLATTTLNIVPAPRSRQRPFRSPSPFTSPATLVPSKEASRRRKIAGPPRRTPKRVNNPNRGVSPAVSETSTMRSSSPPSRTPSLEASDFSSSRTPSFGSTGFSSRSSSASSGPATPYGSPTALPLEIPFHLASPVEAPGPGSAPFQMGGKQQQPYQFAFASYAG
ncbi:hypothetical protein DFH07DRAFT_533203 [Mycena maculata]|uniref:Homeobox domain-containing protein n=1 Tax=Mycena maculata TaxID=230809 RepID=A0AAD7N9C8_9AGAR|nr:hypothetical protein DFH07DRAFT_533203 [Mycena maculata]